MNSEMDKPMYLEDEKQPRDEAFELYKQFLKLNKSGMRNNNENKQIYQLTS